MILSSSLSGDSGGSLLIDTALIAYNLSVAAAAAGLAITSTQAYATILTPCPIACLDKIWQLLSLVVAAVLDGSCGQHRQSTSPVVLASQLLVECNT